MPRLLAQLAFNYDLDFGPSGELYVSANPGFAGNRIERIDPAQGTRETVVQLAGASGPVAVDDAGNVYTVDVPASFPPPPGSYSVLRYTAAQIAFAASSGTPLTANEARIVRAGLDGGARNPARANRSPIANPSTSTSRRNARSPL